MFRDKVEAHEVMPKQTKKKHGENRQTLRIQIFFF